MRFTLPQAWRHILAAVILICARPSDAGNLWVTGYYPAEQAEQMAASNIDFSAITHVIHFALAPNADGSVTGIDSGACRELVAVAHAAGRKALICVGGADTEPGFVGATAKPHLGSFVTNLVNYMNRYSYDGIDLDWEPLPERDFAQYTNFVLRLRTAISAQEHGGLLTAAVSAYPIYGDPADSEYAMMAGVQRDFDQINVMSYDLSGPYDGWISWFNAPVYDGGCRFASTGRAVPSLDGAIRGFVRGGVEPGKLGVGIPFYGVVWAGSVSGPRQPWRTAPKVTQMSYAQIMADYYRSNCYHWDADAQAAYLSIDPPNDGQDIFVSFDNEKSCAAKVHYAREQHLGGVMIWHLGHDYLPDQPSGKRDPLLEAIHEAQGR